MKKFKSLSFIAAAALLLLGAGPLQPVFAGCRGTFLGKKVMVAVSTTIASPTQIVDPSPRTCSEVKIMLHWSGSGTKPNSEFLLLSDSATGFSSSASTGTLRIPAGNSPQEFFDLGEYAGPLYGVVIGTTSAQNVSVVRKH